MQAQHSFRRPLAAFPRVCTHRVDEAEDAVGRIFCQHRLTPSRRAAPGFHAVHNHVGHDGFSVNYVSYGADVVIEPGQLDRFYLLQIPLAGGSRVQCGSHSTHTSTRRASLISPTLETTLHWREGTGQLIILLERGRVERLFGALSGRAAQSVEFEPGVGLESPAGASVLAQARLMLSLSENGHVPAMRIARHQARDMLTNLLLTFQPHSRSTLLAQEPASVAPRHIRRAEEYMEAHAGEPVSFDELAAIAGVSLRTLQAGFRRFRNLTLSEAMQSARLKAWHDLLRCPSQTGGVVALAAQAGITHPGRMAAHYRARFGENPSHTQQAAKRKAAHRSKSSAQG